MGMAHTHLTCPHRFCLSCPARVVGRHGPCLRVYRLMAVISTGMPTATWGCCWCSFRHRTRREVVRGHSDCVQCGPEQQQDNSTSSGAACPVLRILPPGTLVRTVRVRAGASTHPCCTTVVARLWVVWFRELFVRALSAGWAPRSFIWLGCCSAQRMIEVL